MGIRLELYVIIFIRKKSCLSTDSNPASILTMTLGCKVEALASKDGYEDLFQSNFGFFPRTLIRLSTKTTSFFSASERESVKSSMAAMALVGPQSTLKNQRCRKIQAQKNCFQKAASLISLLKKSSNESRSKSQKYVTLVSYLFQMGQR